MCPSKLWRKNEKDLQKKLLELELNLGMTPSPDMLEAFTEVKQELDKIHLDRIKGSVVRSRTELVENNERNTRYFLNLEKGTSILNV